MLYIAGSRFRLGIGIQLQKECSKMKISGIAAFAALVGSLLVGGPVSAQQKGVQIAHPIGIVTKDTQVVTIGDKGVVNQQAAGTKCTLWEGDTVKIVGTTADGKQIVQRTVGSLAKRALKGKMYSGASCKPNNPVVADTPDVTAWLQKAAEDASKAAKPAGKKG